MKRDPGRARPVAALVAVALGTVLTSPPPAHAASPAPGPLAAAAAASGSAMAPAAALRAAQSPAPAPAAPVPPAGRSFFKTPTGAAALALMAGTLGYAVYSFSNGRVKSPSK